MIYFDNTQGDRSLRVFIETTTAAELSKLYDKLYTHSEYDTEWEKKIEEYQVKGYFQRIDIEELRGYKTVVKVLTFSAVTQDPVKLKAFRRELMSYIDDHHEFGMGHHEITYKPHQDEEDGE
jgi:hypothetical protein